MNSIACLLLCFALASPEEPRTESGLDEQDGPDTVVICPAEFRDALEPWVEYRRRQGHRLLVLPSSDDPELIRADILRVAEAGELKSVVLIGDVPPESLTGPEVDDQRRRLDKAIIDARKQRIADWHVPTFFVPAKVNVQFGSSEEIASDIGFSDLDSDGQPDLSIGRLPVDTPDQLTNLIARIISYENRLHTDYSARRVNILAEPGNFGAIADSILEMTAKRFIRSGIPSAYDINTVFANSRSPFCPDPRQLLTTNLERLNEGALFWVYIGHGQSWYLHPMRHADRWFSLLDSRNVQNLACQNHPPIAVFFCCYTGAFDGEHDCLAEEMMLTDGGPIASFAATRVTMPFAMTVMADALLREHFSQSSDNLGELVLRAKRASSRPADDGEDPRRWMFQLAQLFSPTREMLDDELRENSALYNLLGDPLLRLSKPNDVELKVAERIDAANLLTVEGTLPNPGRVTIELCYRRDRVLHEVSPRNANSANELDWVDWQVDYEKSNERVCRYEVVDLPAGPFTRDIWVPSYARGACNVRVFVQHETGFDLGATDVYVKASTLESSSLRQTRREPSTTDQR